MLPFPVEIKPGLPIAEQVVFAVKKAVATGRLAAGDPFPSVRQLSMELKINPNTAHKIVAALVSEGTLIATPAVGTTVAAQPGGSRREKTAFLNAEIERLVVEASALGITSAELKAAIDKHWKKIGGA
ncbi:GntR family transcriptional regulator [Ereboglobus sp. PH5-5]|uniref:GntR family transcriptional regulator n=1 Tax=unclassified Ereboglobus TaxID=2626932 RepID=UPI0024076EB8|nr:MULTISPECIES: GntR family transcriptional regulator [unclassified Ereboglobus]MDF9827482.1 GntR family transcriptional regulator [Ereboglobus sp. PH5-10]MDF9834125.1 GntR family transcriptional regulator [Ereboglobus sp. PH5-5]